MAFISPKDIDEYVVIVHTKTEFYFNGYSNDPNRQKNSLSKTHYRGFIRNQRRDKEILQLAFGERSKIIEGKFYMYNHMVYEGSWLATDLKKYYIDLEYLPFSDFEVKTDPKWILKKQFKSSESS